MFYKLNITNKVRVIFLAGIVLFMQSYLAYHTIEHYDHQDLHDHESAQVCELCLSVQHINQALLPIEQILSKDLAWNLVLFLYIFISFFSFALLLPQTRAPPSSSY